MEDALGPIDIEFLINNPELLEQSKQAQTTLTNAINKMETDLATLKKAADDALKIDPLAVNNYVSQINRLEAALVEKRRVLETLVTSQIDTRPIADGLREVEQVGVRTFEQVGESAVKSTNYFKAAWSSLRQIAYALPGIGVAGIIGFATEPIIAYLSKLDLFKAKLTELKLKQDEMNNAFASSDYTNAIKNINKLTIDIDLAKQGFLDKTKVLNEYNTVLGETIGRADSLDKAESLIVQKGNAYIQMTLLKAAANLAAADSAKKAYEAAQIQAKPVDDFASIFELPVQNRTAADVEASEKNLAAARKARQDAQVKEAQDQSDKFLKIQKDFETKAAEIAKKYHLDFFGGKQDGSNEQQNALNALLQTEIGLRERIVEFTSRQNEKSLSPDQQALTQISDQFAAITFQINQANDKYDAFVKKYGQAAVDTFNASPDNKVKLAKTDPATLAVAENAAIDNQADLNENNYIQQDIEKKKKLYADYYAYRAKVGEDAANKEYADLLLSGKDFATYLSNIEKSIPADDQSGAMQ
ncbi:MAG TPA: hypothetical protein VL442_12845, partial [Mucilaginibacter sp.]|nr:hypothetical protein [Mucilaginibacter sp.]